MEAPITGEVIMKDKLVPVEKDGLGPCVDGRKADQKLRGPKIQGGVLGVAALGLGKTGDQAIDENDIRLACQKVKTAGFTPAVHGDNHHQESGCGFGRLWGEGKLDNLPKLGVSLDKVKEIVLEEGGQYVELEGEHTEQKVVINYIQDKTLEPDGTAFILDAWAADLFGIDQSRLVANASEVVAKLNGPTVVQAIR